ncbi:MAG: hypothetical protein KAH04_03870 [Psychrilyobacter sp.]|nr:hypothetical protein [Psychrilyobacter sp.]
MDKIGIKVDMIILFIFIIFLSIFTIIKIKNSYDLSSLASMNKNLLTVRKSIDEFYEYNNNFPTIEEIRGQDEEEKFFKILSKNSHIRVNFFKNFEFPSTPKYLKTIAGIPIEINSNNHIKLAKNLDSLGISQEYYSSNGGWIYSPLNGEFRANLQDIEGRDKKEDLSRPVWGSHIDWYYK